MFHETPDVVYKQIDEMLIASIRAPLQKRAELPARFAKLSQHCRDFICGPAFIVYHLGTGIEGFDIEAGFPVTRPVERDEIQSRVLESAGAVTVIHRGPYETLAESYQKLYACFREHGLMGSLSQREVFLESNPDNPEDNVTEIQAILHDWDQRFADNLERILGADAKETVMRGIDDLTVESSADERLCWTKTALATLDSLADEGQKYQVLSPCAHVFPRERIERLRAIYEQTADLDEVLKVMREDPFWYENPAREGSTIYVQKNPFDPEGYERATTVAEKRMHYCHCSLIRQRLDNGISPTFCYCGAGWYRQLWEGILGRPVRLEFLKSLTRGDDVCQVAIHLPV
jgi:AraC family transcriptional regulator